MEKHERLLAYTLLITFLLADVVVFRLFSNRPTFQFLLVILAVLVYVGWGVWVHHLEERLSEAVIAEYIFLGLLVALLFYLQMLV